MKTTRILTQELEVKQTDFELNKLSDKFGKLFFKGYRKAEVDRNRANQANAVDHIKVMVTTEDAFDLTIKIPLETDNVVKLDKLEMFKPIDFEECLVSHMAQVSGTFASIMQTIKANKLIIVNQSNQPSK